MSMLFSLKHGNLLKDEQLVASEESCVNEHCALTAVICQNIRTQGLYLAFKGLT